MPYRFFPRSVMMISSYFPPQPPFQSGHNWPKHSTEEEPQGNLECKDCRMLSHTPISILRSHPSHHFHNVGWDQRDSGHDITSTYHPLYGTNTQRHFGLLRDSMSYIGERYNAERVIFYEWTLVVETSNPPKPIPLPARFVSPGDCGYVDLLAPYCSRRIADPFHMSLGGGRRPLRKSRCVLL